MALMKALIAEDERITNSVLSGALSESGYFDEVLSASSGKEAIYLFKKHTPGFALLDIEMPNRSGLQVAQEILTKYRTTKIVLITAREDENTICEMYSLRGIYGCIMKSAHTLDSLKTCLDKVIHGNTYFSRKYSDLVLKCRSSSRCYHKILTHKERQLLSYIGSGYSHETISDILKMPLPAVRYRERNIRRKLKVSSRCELMTIANEKGFANGRWKRMDLIGNYALNLPG